MALGFWKGGPDAYLRGLGEHYEPRLAELREALENATEKVDQERLRRKIESTHREYREKSKAAGRCLF